MVPDPDPPTVGRRALLAGAGAALVAATGVVGAVQPTALPDTLTDQASKYLPEPTDHRWHPPVSEAHARDTVGELAKEVERGRELWAELDTDERFGGAGGWLESAREELRAGNYHEATFYATGGMQFAAEDVGIALARLGRPAADPDRLAERGEAIRDRADDLVADIGDYPVVDAGRDLGWYHDIERWVVIVRLDAHERDPDSDREYDEPDDVGALHAGNRQAELRLATAEHYREQLRDRIGDGGEPTVDRIARLNDRFRDGIEEYPDSVEIRERLEAVREEHGDGPYTLARRKLATWCFDNDHVVTDWKSDLTLVQTVEAAQMLTNRRAHDRALEALVVDPADDGFDSGHVVREKRAAMREFRRVVGNDPAPLLSILTERAGEDIDVAEVGFAGSYERPLWRDRVEAYCYALIGRTKLQAYPRVYERVVE
ncbi:hypothetical protein [Halobaculum litoreum]|uniref:Tat (Twin-arginine translocation) pathway signal sequence n=1 Tax=Halobaculum litoreum TaxID=3031998 RepID=A0ABD5XK16_9EURY|nr:hypothetical protein [Halobaculum sp. DT92]